MPDVLGIVSASFAAGNAVITLEKRTRRAAPSVLVDVRALQTVSFEHLSFRGIRHALLVRFARTLRSFLVTEALLPELCDQEVDRLVDDGRKVPARIAMGHQVSGELELVLQLLVRGELDAE